MFERNKEMFAYEPLHGFTDDQAAPELPWDRVGDLFLEGQPENSQESRRPAH